MQKSIFQKHNVPRKMSLRLYGPVVNVAAILVREAGGGRGIDRFQKACLPKLKFPGLREYWRDRLSYSCGKKSKRRSFLRRTRWCSSRENVQTYLHAEHQSRFCFQDFFSAVLVPWANCLSVNNFRLDPPAFTPGLNPFLLTEKNA